MTQESDSMQAMQIAILVTDGFEQIEMTSPRDALTQLGASTKLISQKAGKVQGFNHHDRADQFNVDLTFSDAQADQFDAVLLPGGVINGDQMRVIPEAKTFVQQMEQAGKPLFVICHGGWLLASAGLVDGRTMTSWPTLQDDLRNAGAAWVDQEVVVDGNLVSSRKPADLPAFNQKIADVLRQYQQQRQTGGVHGRASEQRGGIGLAG